MRVHRLLGLLFLASSANAQTIELRKVRVLADADGKGFTRAPMRVQPLPGGRYALSEMNVLPLIVDSAGRLVRRWPKGEGPGEVAGMAAFSLGRNDTLYVNSDGRISIFDRELKFVRSFAPQGGYFADLIPAGDAFVGSAQRQAPGGMTSIHIVSRDGRIVRSFLKDTIIDRRAMRPEYRIALGSSNTVWAASNAKHRIERWTLSGTRQMVIDTTPAWFVSKYPEYMSHIKDLREDAGVLWVLSGIPVADYTARMREAMKGANGEVDARVIPFEQMTTTRLEAYDVATGRLLSDLPIKAYPIAILANNQLMVHTAGADDTARLEIWEFRLKR